MTEAEILPTSDFSRIKNLYLYINIYISISICLKDSGARIPWAFTERHHAIMRVLAKDCVVLQAVWDGECHPLRNDNIWSELWASATFLLQSPVVLSNWPLTPTSVLPPSHPPTASVKLQAHSTSRPSSDKWDWLDYPRQTGKSCLLFWTKTRADTSRRRSSSKESRHDFMNRAKFLQRCMNGEWLTDCTVRTSDASSRISPLARGNWPWLRPRLWWLQEIRTVMAGSGWKVGASGETASHLWPDDKKEPTGKRSCPLVSAETSAQDSTFKCLGKW